MKRMHKSAALLLAVWFMLGIFGLPCSASAQNRTYIDAVSLSCDLQIQTGQLTQDVNVVILQGTPAYPAFVYWQKKINSVWYNMIPQRYMTPGTYRAYIQIRCDLTIDGLNGKDYYVDENTKVTLNGTQAEITGSRIEPSYSYIEIHSPEFTVERTISSLEVTGVPEPIVGKTLDPKGVTLSEGFKIDDVRFQILENGEWKSATKKVVAGESYRLSLAFHRYSDYEFTPEIRVSVNGSSTDADGNPLVIIENGTSLSLVCLLPRIQKPEPHISIRGYVPERTERYFTTIGFECDVTDLPDDAQIAWFVNDVQMLTGSQTFAYYGAKKDFTVQCKVIRAGETLAASDVETVRIRQGFFDVLFSLFRVLISRPYTIVQ